MDEYLWDGRGVGTGEKQSLAIVQIGQSGNEEVGVVQKMGRGLTGQRERECGVEPRDPDSLALTIEVSLNSGISMIEKQTLYMILLRKTKCSKTICFLW